MRAATIIATLVSGAATIAAAATGTVPISNLPPPQLAVMSGIDVVPQTAQIEAAFGPAPFDDLLAIARDAAEDPGVRLRAYRALSLYPGAVTRNALRADLAAMGTPDSGTETLYLRAMIEALGLVGESPDVSVLEPYLDFESSRDIRAATADALREIGDTTALPALRARLPEETSAQVRYAIERALRELGQPL